MRPLLFILSLASLVPACGGIASNSGGSSSDAGHDAGHLGTPEASPREAATPEASAPETGGRCSMVSAIWALMDMQAIILGNGGTPHEMVAGIDLDGPDYLGTTLQEVTFDLCTGHPLGAGPGGTLIEGWGHSNEVRFLYNPTTYLVLGAELFPGYDGTLTLRTDPAGADKGHDFLIVVGSVITRDGAPFAIDWADPTFTTGNELYNALAYSSAGYAGYDATPCTTSGACTVTTTGTTRQWTLVAQEQTYDFASVDTQPAATTVTEIDLGVPRLGMGPGH